MNRLLRVFLILPPLLAQAQNGPEAPADPLRGLWKPVRLIAKDIDVVAAFQEISRQAGNPSVQWPPTLEPKKIDLRLEQATFWQALDEICRLHGNLRFSSDPDELTAHLDRRAWVEPRAAYAGPFRFYVQQIVRVREIKYPERRDRIELTIQRRETEEPPRGFDWTGKGRKLDLVAAVSDTGRSLLPLLKIDDPYVHAVPIFNSFGNRITFLLQPPLSNEKSIARIDAVWTQVVLEDPETIRFDPAIPSVGRTHRVGPISVTLTSLKPGERRGQPGYYDVEFLVKLDPAGLSDADRKSYSEIPVEERLLRNGFRATPTPFGSYQLVRGDDPLQVTIKGSLIGSGAAVSWIECAVARKARLLTVPFTITNLRLPEE